MRLGIVAMTPLALLAGGCGLWLDTAPQDSSADADVADAGMDAQTGPGDGGTRDGAPRDAGTDANVPVLDAGPLDAGPPDAGRPPLPAPATLAAGAAHTCAVVADGSILCWGGNDVGQLGNGMAGTPRPTPAAVVGLPTSIGVAAAGQYTCALAHDGTVLCWGADNVGQIGDGGGTSAPFHVTPTPVGSVTFARVDCGDYQACAIETGSGEVDCWGQGIPTLGIRLPHAVGATATSVGAGSQFGCAADGGSVQCWGINFLGELGDGTTTDRPTPAPVLDLTDVVQVDSGVEHACALRTDGTVACWGAGANGQLGDGSTHVSQTRPVDVADLADAVQIALGSYHSCAVRATGEVACWGFNSHGQLGDGTRTDSARPVPVAGLTDAAEVAAGFQHTCARRRTGEIVCWGANDHGQLGDGTVVDHPTPVSVLLP